jgi:PKD repeat protein
MCYVHSQARRVVTAGWIAVIILGLSTVAGHAADIDLETEIVSAPELADPTEVVTFTVDYSNNSAIDSNNGRLRLILPSGLFLDWSTEERDAVQASITDSLGNSGEVQLDEVTCDKMLISIKGSGGSPPSIPAGTTGQFSVDIPLPGEIPSAGMLVVHSPASVEGIYDFALGECDDCGDLSSCFGGPLSQTPAVTGDLELVNDPAGADPSQGCGALDGFTAGNIAVVRRGTCEFGTKALNAETAGAGGVLIVNNQPNRNIHSIGLGGGSNGGQVTIPVVLVSYEDGEALIDAVESKAQVSASLGAIQTEDLLFSSTAFHATIDSDANGLNDSDAVITTVDYIVNEPPEASFTFEPANPIKGQQIVFTDTSSNEPTSWSWDFGDGIGTSDQQNPSYTYSDAGTYTVTLTATNEFGEGSTTEQVVVGNLLVGGSIYYIPAAAFAEGDEGAFFITDVEVNNPGDMPMTYQFVWLPRGQDNSTPLTSSAFMLAPNGSARYQNILSEVFELEDALGAIGVLANRDDALLMSRTFNRPEEGGGTFGQGLPGVPVEAMTVTGQRQRILFLSETEQFRGNLGCQNGSPKSIRVLADLYSADGTLLETRPLDIPIWSSSQINRIFAAYEPLEAGFVDVYSNTTDARFYCYGSLADNVTSDPTTILPQ